MTFAFDCALRHAYSVRNHPTGTGEMNMPRSVAFKCTFNDGDSGDFVGLRGTCSRDLMVLNVNTHVWCSQPKNACRQFVDLGMKGAKPLFPCMESELFEFWRFNGGTWHNGPKRGQQIPIKDSGIGKIAVLTTRKPDVEEVERKIIGLYEIGEIDHETNLIAHPQFRVRLLAKDSERLNFCRYYRNASDPKPVWGTMLFRYLEDATVHTILKDISEIVGGKTRETVDLLMARHFGRADAPPACGALAIEPSIKRDAAIAKKYLGGEGPYHKALKEWIATHPQEIGLPQNARADVEHLFASTDCVDIAFTLLNGSKVVVEIETTQPLPGAHQVIKYRSLMAAEMGWPLDTDRVAGVLVAWEYTPMVLAFCSDYAIAPWRCRTGETGTLADT